MHKELLAHDESYPRPTLWSRVSAIYVLQARIFTFMLTLFIPRLSLKSPISGELKLRIKQLCSLSCPSPDGAIFIPVHVHWTIQPSLPQVTPRASHTIIISMKCAELADRCIYGYY